MQQPLRHLSGVADTVRHTGDHTVRAQWHSSDEIGRLVQHRLLRRDLGHQLAHTVGMRADRWILRTQLARINELQLHRLDQPLHHQLRRRRQREQLVRREIRPRARQPAPRREVQPREHENHQNA